MTTPRSTSTDSTRTRLAAAGPAAVGSARSAPALASYAGDAVTRGASPVAEGAIELGVGDAARERAEAPRLRDVPRRREKPRPRGPRERSAHADATHARVGELLQRRHVAGH